MFHIEGRSDRFGFYYTLTRAGSAKSCPRTGCWDRCWTRSCPDGVGMTFDEEMVGWYLEAEHSAPDRAGDLTIAARDLRRRGLQLPTSA